MQNNNLSQFFKNEINKFVDSKRLSNNFPNTLSPPYIASDVKANNNMNNLNSNYLSHISNSGGGGGGFVGNLTSNAGGRNISIEIFDIFQQKKSPKDNAYNNNNINNNDNKDGNNSAVYIAVQSSNLKAVKYETSNDKATYGKLYVQFLNGGEYSYENVPNTTYKSLMENSSHGSYFYWNIRGSGVPYPINPPFAYAMLVAPNHWHKTHNTVKIWNNIIKKRYNNFKNIHKCNK